jgi:hypothetical protein
VHAGVFECEADDDVVCKEGALLRGDPTESGLRGNPLFHGTSAKSELSAGTTQSRGSNLFEHRISNAQLRISKVSFSFGSNCKLIHLRAVEASQFWAAPAQDPCYAMVCAGPGWTPLAAFSYSIICLL